MEMDEFRKKSWNRKKTMRTADMRFTTSELQHHVSYPISNWKKLFEDGSDRRSEHPRLGGDQ